MIENSRKLVMGRGILLLVGLMFITSSFFAESYYTVIKNPLPTMKEKNFIKLEKVGEIVDEVAKDVFLFLPFSMTMDDRNFLYVYDLMQARILIFDSTFDYVSSLGGVGSGPGEFSSTGRNARVTLYFGLDGKLYANDKNAFKILVFDTKERKYLKDIRYDPRYYSAYFLDELPVDSRGNLILMNFYDNKLVVFNDKVLYTLPHEEQKKEILFFEKKMLPSISGRMPPKFPFNYMIDELVIKYTRRNTLMVYFPLSATLITVPPDGKPKKTRIWVDRAISDLHDLWKSLKDGYGFSPLYETVFLDGDNPDFIYFSGSGTWNEFHFYKVNLNGELTAVMTVPRTKKERPKFLLKKNNLFFGIINENIVIYKE